MARREYKGAATPTTITGGITNSSTSLTLTDATNWPTGSFSLVIDPGLAGEEKILAASRSGTTVTLTTRGYDNTTASSHTAGAIIYPVPTAIDFDEANALVNTPTTKGDILAASAASTMARVAVGANNKILTADSSASSGVKWGDGPLSTKGDLYTYDTAGNRLAVGNNGETLVADSSTSTGLRYQGSMVAGKNAAIGGGFDIWQRGTSFSSGASPIYTADRWCFNRSGGDTGATVSRQVTGDTTNLPFIQYCGRVQRNSGNTTTTGIALWQSLETVNSIPYAGKTITFSFYARAGANYSSASNVLTAAFYTGTGTDQNINVTGYTGQTNTSNNATLTTTWQRFSYQISIPATATEIGYIFSYAPSGTAGANDYFEITGVQVEVGSVATQFSRAGGTIQGELAACQRYYWEWRSTQDAFQQFALGVNTTTTANRCIIQNPVTMRTKPSVSISAASTFAASSGGITISSGFVMTSNTTQNIITIEWGGTGYTKGYAYGIESNNTNSAYLLASAEL